MYQIFGTIKQPEPLNRFGTVESGGIGNLLQLIINLMIVGGGLFALFNFLLAGYGFLSAGDDPKAIQNAWAKIYQTAIGLLFLVGSFLLAAIFGLLIYGDATALLSPTLPTP